MNLLETYKGRISISEKYYSQTNNGEKMSNSKKLVTAQCLHNVANFLNESFANSAGTQRSDMAAFKKFCLDVTTITTPNLVVHDMFLVQPMTSFTGYITYLRFKLNDSEGTILGDYTGQLLKPMTEERSRYTSSSVVEEVTLASNKATLTFKNVKIADGKLLGGRVVADGVEIEHTAAIENGVCTITCASKAAGKVKVAYVYDNEIVPQVNPIPSIKAEMEGITLTAKARRIGIQYSQFAAYQMKTDYGMDLESMLMQQAQAELQAEIDGEAVTMLKEAADAYTDTHVEWTDEQLDTLAYSLKAESFLKAVELTKAKMYKANGKVLPTYMVVSPSAMTVLSFIPGFKPSNASVANGAYIAGNLNGLKVIVSPQLIAEEKESVEAVCYFGVLGADGKTATGVFAPYMNLVPTQLLGFADGRMEQGFSALYDMKILNPRLVGKITINVGDNMAAVKNTVAE